MSKKVTSVTRTPVYVEGVYLAVGSDGNIYNVGSGCKKGTILVEENNVRHDTVLNKKGIAAVKKSIKVLEQIEKLKAQLKPVTGATDYEGLGFESENGETLVTVGCTSVQTDDVIKAFKALGV